MKKALKISTGLAAIGTLAALFFGIPFANAQLFLYGPMTTVSSSVTGPGTTTTSSDTNSMSGIIVTSSTSNASSSLSPSLSPNATVTAPTLTAPITLPQPTNSQPNAGFIEFNGLVVNEISATTIPTTILATNPAFSMNGSPGTASAAANAASVMPETCKSFSDEFSGMGTALGCPTPPLATGSTTTYGPFTIEVTTATQLLLRDRAKAVLANITPGDSINVFGYYDGTGSIRADIIRDVSKPIAGITAPPVTIADLQAEIAQIETLLAQLVNQINTMGTSSNSSTTNVDSSAPMIPAPSSTTMMSPSSTSQ